MRAFSVFCKGLLIAYCLLFILKVTAQDEPSVFVQAQVDNATPYVGQQLTYTFKLFDSIGLTNPLYEASNFEGFWRYDWGNVTQSVQPINGKQYTISLVNTALFATSSGMFTIAPAKVVLPETVFSSKQEIAADPITIQVQSLPEGAPPEFSGAVGQFDMTATVSRLSANLGEPLSVRLTVTGTGNVEQLQRPAITLPPTWRTNDEAPSYSAVAQGNQIVGTKDFVISIFPGSAGQQTLPSITLNYFDPATVSYRSVSTSPIALEILPLPDSTTNPENANASSASAGSPLIIRPALANLTTVVPSPAYFLWIIPILIMFGAVGWRMSQQRMNKYRSQNHRLNALRSAREKLRSIHQEQSDTVSECIHQIVFEYVGDKLDTTVKPSDLEAVLVSQSIPPSVRSQLRDLLDSINEGLYGPVEADVNLLVKQIAETLRKIDEVWKPL